MSTSIHSETAQRTRVKNLQGVRALKSKSKTNQKAVRSANVCEFHLTPHRRSKPQRKDKTMELEGLIKG